MRNFERYMWTANPKSNYRFKPPMTIQKDSQSLVVVGRLFIIC